MTDPVSQAIDEQVQSAPLEPLKRRRSIYAIYEKMLTTIERRKKTRRSKRGGKKSAANH
jgi:hypothetical protein